MTKPKLVPESERAMLGLQYLNVEEVFLLKKPELMLKYFSLLRLYDANKQYPIFAPNTIVMEGMCEPSILEPEVTVDRLRLVEESIFCIRVEQSDNELRDDPATLRKALVTACDLSTDSDDGWLEIPKFYAFEKLLRFQLR